MTTKKIILPTVAALSLSVAASLALAQGQARPPQAGGAQQQRVQQPQAQQVIQDWKPDAKEAARTVLEKYGEPDEVTHHRLVWHENGPWKRTEVLDEEIPHNFPMPHNDMLYQTINHEVPADKVAELAEFTGSVLVDRVKGELTARCDKEEANFLSINLAHRIVEGEIDPQQAREMYAMAMQDEAHTELKQDFAFQVPQEPQRDPGVQFGGREEEKEKQKK